jgi:hypothetical protein
MKKFLVFLLCETVPVAQIGLGIFRNGCRGVIISQKPKWTFQLRSQTSLGRRRPVRWGTPYETRRWADLEVSVVCCSLIFAHFATRRSAAPACSPVLPIARVTFSVQCSRSGSPPSNPKTVRGAASKTGLGHWNGLCKNSWRN